MNNTIDYAKFFSRSHHAVIRVYDDAGNGRTIGVSQQILTELRPDDLNGSGERNPNRI
jgi:hypothetical protein